MTIYKLPECTPVASLPEGAVLCLGNFDGVHRGHQRLFDCAREMKDAKEASAACAWTFTSVAKAGGLKKHKMLWIKSVKYTKWRKIVAESERNVES